MWDDARAYDLITGSFVDDLPYWTWLMTSLRPRRVLELGCGTGRLAAPIVAAGRAAHGDDFRFVGLDTSASFLRRAEARLAEVIASGAARLIEGDMRSFALGESFDLIVCGFNNLAYIHEFDDQLGCFAAVRRHLAPEGRFAIDLQTPPLGIMAEAQTVAFPTVRKELDAIDPAPGVRRAVAFYTTNRYDTARQIESTTHFWELYDDGGRRESHVKDLVWRHYFPRELELLLRHAALHPVERYGSYAREPFGDRSSLYLWVMAGG